MKRREFLTRTGGGATAAAAAVATGSASAGAQEEQEGATVGMEAVAFAPEEITVPPGTTVTFENTSQAAHSVTAYEDGVPDGAEYWASGGFDSESAARNGWPDEGRLEPGDTFEHTFEELGDHEFFCIPHEQVGMEGVITVQESGGGAEQLEPEHLGVPFRAHFVGIATILAIMVSLVYTFYVLKYGESAHASSPNRK